MCTNFWLAMGPRRNMTHGGMRLEGFVNRDFRAQKPLGSPYRPPKKNPEAESQSEVGGVLPVWVWADASAEGLRVGRFYA